MSSSPWCPMTQWPSTLIRWMRLESSKHPCSKHQHLEFGDKAFCENIVWKSYDESCHIMSFLISSHEPQATGMDRGEWTKAMDVYSFEPSIYEVWQDPRYADSSKFTWRRKQMI